MFELSVLGYFEAAHRLIEYDGKCENLHGHNYKVKLTIKVDKLDGIDLGIDFGRLKDDLKKVTDLFDHKFLNELSDFGGHNPSAEIIGKVIYEKVKEASQNDYLVSSVTVWETDNSSSTYYETAVQ